MKSNELVNCWGRESPDIVVDEDEASFEGIFGLVIFLGRVISS